MKSTTMAIAIGVTLLTSGCVTYREARNGTAWPWPTDKPVCAHEECGSGDALDAFNKANAYCRSLNNRYARDEFGASSGRVALATIGAVSGSVIPPLVTGSAKEAWAGVSGSTNALQSSMNEAFSTTLSVKRRAVLADVAAKSAEAYSQPELNATGQVVAAINMARECSTAPAKAEEKAIKAMMQ